LTIVGFIWSLWQLFNIWENGGPFFQSGTFDWRSECCTWWWVHVKILWPRSGQNFVAQAGLGQPSLVWVWKFSPKNFKFFNFLLFGSTKVFLGQVKKYPGKSQVGLLFTVGQKYMVWLCQGPSQVVHQQSLWPWVVAKKIHKI